MNRQSGSQRFEQTVLVLIIQITFAIAENFRVNCQFGET